MQRRTPTQSDRSPTEDLLLQSAAGSSIFAYSLFLALADLPLHPMEMPPEHWQAALGRRPLTPMEQLARECYFERKISEALARATGSK